MVWRSSGTQPTHAQVLVVLLEFYPTGSAHQGCFNAHINCVAVLFCNWTHVSCYHPHILMELLQMFGLWRSRDGDVQPGGLWFLSLLFSLAGMVWGRSIIISSDWLSVGCGTEPTQSNNPKYCFLHKLVRVFSTATLMTHFFLCYNLHLWQWIQKGFWFLHFHGNFSNKYWGESSTGSCWWWYHECRWGSQGLSKKQFPLRMVCGFLLGVTNGSVVLGTSAMN